VITAQVIGWLVAVFALPLACVGLAQTRLSLERMRVASIAAATVLLGVSAIPLFVPELGAFHLAPPSIVPGTAALLRLDELSVVLPSLAAFLWLFTIVVTPRPVFGVDRIRGTAASTVFATYSSRWRGWPMRPSSGSARFCPRALRTTARNISTCYVSAESSPGWPRRATTMTHRRRRNSRRA